MKSLLISTIGAILLTVTACTDFNIRNRVTIPDFNFPQSVVFEENLSAYHIFEGEAADLVPSNDFHLLELTSILFTDYAHKQRLVRIPAGSQMTKLDDGSIDFPNGTLLSKTFFYYNDERDTTLGKRIIETRLLIKENNIWNAASYLWNEAQTDATLALDGFDMQVSWINTGGNSLSTLYHIPNENECITCHQSSSKMKPLGPTLRNLNRTVERNGNHLNQINHLQSVGVLNDFEISEIPQIVDYNDLNMSLAERGRAYLAMNCAHCHQPDGWDAAARNNLDFRYETPLHQTGITTESNRITNALLDEEMPFVGTTLLDQEGVSLVLDFIESL